MGLYSIIIADDEPIIRESLASFLNWGKLGFQLKLIARDGAEVIAQLDQGDVDVVLTDIRMKNVSGLDVAQYAYEHAPDTQVVLISGYHEFEFARQAMAYNVRHYLLKPIDIGVIEETFTKVKAELDKQRQTSAARTAGLQKLNAYRRAARQRLFEFAVMGIFQKNVDLNGYLKQFDLYDELVSIHCNMFELAPLPENNSQQLNEDLLIGIASMISEKYNFGFIPAVLKKPGRYLIVQGSVNEIEEGIFYTYRREFIQAVNDLCNVHADLRGRQLNIDIYEMIDMLGAEQERSPLSKELYRSYASQYLLILNSSDSFEEASQLVCTIFGSMSEEYPRYQKRECAAGILEQMRELLLKQYAGCSFEVPELKPAGKYDPDELIRENLSAFYKALRQISVQENSAVEIIKQYIVQNIDKIITLQQVADTVFLSPNYLSRYFKEQTGEKFSDYISRMKMRKAAEMLDSRQYKVYEISDCLGYKSVQYFYKLFKKYYGCTPSEYRKAEEA
ncbi:response regulator transcription factor [Diplocloster modestus]|uniref:Stage 0 sporulation protein A homolog n=1 Tax=Diplocloster modestus TaxID=2850322 RepID=A0ABS6K8I2_9FIRM|nr:helix-turn-helix domain-containing protein [Diplocloster modestus]MBU9726830.1 response regulator [Diplocloster modestus]